MPLVHQAAHLKAGIRFVLTARLFALSLVLRGCVLISLLTTNVLISLLTTNVLASASFNIVATVPFSAAAKREPR